MGEGNDFLPIVDHKTHLQKGSKAVRMSSNPMSSNSQRLAQDWKRILQAARTPAAEEHRT